MKRIIVLCSIFLLLVPFSALAQTTTTIPIPLFCEGNFDCDQDVDGTDASIFKEDFGRSGLSNPCSYLNDCPTPWSPCPEGMLWCNNSCADPTTDEANCGGCNVTCSGQCLAGVCQQEIPAPMGKTGQTTSFATGDDGDLEKGVPWPNPRFTDNGDGTVTDNLTGLIWLKNANCFGTRTWNNALSDCNGLSAGYCGLTDGSSPGNWRLPNKRELISITHDGCYYPAVPNTTGTGCWSAGDPFIIVQSDTYWSSTTYTNISDGAWFVDMYNGYVGIDNKPMSCYVWPVRGGR